MFRYKDIKPEETLSNIQTWLNDIGIQVSEKWFPSGIDNVFSLRIEILPLHCHLNQEP